ncbi:DUF3302 domain-containing protein [Bradyrhizobium sp. Bra64]|uniref:DUF3302 domain-containing protein n=1 Tax=Bradyrhizobium sp. Bra64 TaxID=2926009 RepID=UPI00211985B5
MQFTLQGFGPFLHWLTLGILFVMPVVLGLLIFRLGRLPGDIARARHHPQADAISVCGWMGIITLVLWPIAMVWAHLDLPVAAAEGPGSAQATPSQMGKLKQASQRLAAIEASLPKAPAGRGA